MPAVSVIMPAYNVQAYLAESIESVLGQTYRDLELVIVDDGSADGTRAIAERYRAAHPDRIVVVSQENRGLAGARNTGLRVARGAVLALLDSDDAWFATYLEKQMAILEANAAVAIVSGNAFNRGGADDGQPARPIVDLRPPPDLVEILRDETAVFIMSVFRREVLERIGGFDEQFRTNEDYDFWIRAALAGFQFARNSTPLGLYRRHPNSLSASEVRMIAGILRVYRKALPYCEPGTLSHRIATQQIERFETERLTAEARAALDAHDGAAAAAAIDELQQRGGGAALLLLARALRLAPRAAVWAYHARRRLFAMRGTSVRDSLMLPSR